jgi:hypothetical protein
MTQATSDTPLTLSLGALQHWHAALQRALAHCESADALSYVAAAISQLVQVESMMISLECQGRAPRLLYKQGIPEVHRDAVLERYFSAGYLLDPFCLAVQSGLAEGFYHLQEIAPDNFFDSDYYKAYYLGTGCSEDSYYIVDLSEGRKLSFSLFQGCSGTRLSSGRSTCCGRSSQWCASCWCVMPATTLNLPRPRPNGAAYRQRSRVLAARCLRIVSVKWRT